MPTSTTLVPIRPESKPDIESTGCGQIFNRESGNNERGMTNRIYNGTMVNPESYPWQVLNFKI